MGMHSTYTATHYKDLNIDWQARAVTRHGEDIPGAATGDPDHLPCGVDPFLNIIGNTKQYFSVCARQSPIYHPCLVV